MNKYVFTNWAPTNIELKNVKEYKVTPLVYFSQVEYARTVNLYREKMITENSSDNPDDFKKIMTKLYPQFKKAILNSIHESMVESGVHYDFEDVFCDYFIKNHHMASQLLLRLLREQYSNLRIVKAILHIVSHYTYEEIGEDFVFSLTALLNHTNKAIRKFALKVFDNWDAEETLDILQNTMMKETWLNNYKDRIVERLERKSNHAVLFTCN